MKKSIWLERYEKEVNGKRNESNQKKKVIFIIIPVMMLLMLLPSLLSGNLDSQAKTGMLVMVGVFVFVMLFVVLLLGKSKNIDAAKGTRENLMKLLHTDDQVDEFDQQMSMEPVEKIKIGATSDVIITQDYIGITSLHLGDLQYRFARISEIKAIDYAKTSSVGGNPVLASYYFDIKNDQDIIMVQGLAETMKPLEQVIEALKKVQSDIIVTGR